jgi:GNAT superfamily N-acetyltransferase
VIDVRELTADDLPLFAAIDRSEHVEHQYAVVDGRLVDAPVVMADIPAWEPTGSGPSSVRHHIDFCRSVLDDGGALLGAFERADFAVAGLAVVHPTFEPDLAWLAHLHVSRPHRRRGAATALWRRALELAASAGASRLYVSATPTGSAVGFYLRQGCVLAHPVHPRLFEEEPHDVHLVASVGNR